MYTANSMHCFQTTLERWIKSFLLLQDNEAQRRLMNYQKTHGKKIETEMNLRYECLLPYLQCFLTEPTKPCEDQS